MKESNRQSQEPRQLRRGRTREYQECLKVDDRQQRRNH